MTTDAIPDDFLIAYHRGADKLNDLIDTRLVKKTVPFFMEYLE